MKLYTPIDFVAIALIFIHFGVPLLYYSYLRKVGLSRPWDVKADPSFLPKVSIIVPTYNEARFIVKKLDDIRRQNYPMNRMEIIVVDSGSTDGTPELVKKWSEEHPNIHLKLVVEPVRRGKGWALNEALKHVSSDSEIIIVTDVDSWWRDEDTLRKVANMFADPTIGAVSCIKIPHGNKEIESSYRNLYNLVRVAESKLWSTPVFHGELAAFRKKLLEEIGGFPTDIGADDSHTATLIALKGYRSIVHDAIQCIETIPKERYFWWRVRRAQHLIQHFEKILMVEKRPKIFKDILCIEMFLHLFNPWILLIAMALLVASILQGSLLAIILLGIGISMLIMHRLYRMWVHLQLVLMVAAIRNLRTKEIVWRKELK